MSGTEIVRKVVDAFNRHDAAGIAASYAVDAVAYDPYYPEPLRGRDAIREDMEAFFRAFPNIHGAIKSTISDGAAIGFEMAVSGVHSGPLALPSGEIPGTGKTVEFEGGFFVRVNSEGLIIEDHRYYDVLGQMVQLGLIPDEQAVS